jgi:hypothetical protein
MGKLFKTIIILAMLTVIVQIGFNFFIGGYDLTYQVKSDNQSFKVMEKFTTGYKSSYRFKKDKNNYLFQISMINDNNNSFSFKLLGNYNFHQRLIKDIKYYEDASIKCIYPVFRVKNIKNDVLCSQNNEYRYYSTMVGQNAALDNFVKNLYSQYGYIYSGWFKTVETPKKIISLDVYKNNLINKHTLVLWNYKGVKIISNEVSNEINFLLKDNYENKLGALVDNYYITPNYNTAYNFNKFHVLDITSNAKKEILLVGDISTDSYIQGIVNHKLYLFDKSNKVQYEIDPRRKNCIQIGDEENGIQYYNGKWTNISIYDALNDKLFTNEFEVPDLYKKYNFYKIDNVLGDTDGYYYFYVKFNNKIKVYRADKQLPQYITFIFEADNISNIKYIDDYVYFIKDDTIYVYHDSVGLKPIIKSFELLFNKSNVYDVYSK